ncbi:MAG: LamG domain-containing protein [Phaeodactylibacter sp.]|nr:LamG domain-containing protein [Phaeodactylibacter sp.]
MKFSAVSVLFLLTLLFISTAPPHSRLEEGLVAYYSFNACDARDDSGNGSDGALVGGVGCWCGIEDDGLLLDGARSYIEFPGKVNRYFNTSDFTVSFYFKAEQYLVFQQSLLSKREDCDEFGMLDVMLDLNKREVATAVHETPDKYYGGLSPALDTTGWIHFALAREGTRAFTYINGELHRESFRCSGVDISNNAVLSFSNSPCVQNGRARRFKGVLDQLRVYSRALSPEEVRELYREYPVENAVMDCVT